MKINIFLYILCGLSEYVIDVHQHGEILKFYAGRGKSTEPLPPAIGTKNIRDHHVGSKMPSQISIVTSCGFQYHSWLMTHIRRKNGFFLRQLMHLAEWQCVLIEMTSFDNTLYAAKHHKGNRIPEVR